MSGVDEKLRHTLGRVGREFFDETFMREMVEDVRGMTKPVNVDFSCPECNFHRFVKVEIPDVKGRLEAWTKLMAEMEGKPGTDAGDSAGTTIVIERIWPPDSEPIAPHDAGRSTVASKTSSGDD